MKTTKIFSLIVIIFTVAALAVLAALLVLIPYLANSQLLALKYTDGNNAALRIYLYIADLAAIWFMIQMLRIMGSVSRGTPFVEKNVGALVQMSLMCLVAFADFVLMLVIHGNYTCFGIMTCAVVLLFGALCAYVLSRVFAEAVRCKAENDLTI